jgi:glycogen operon protein
VASHNAELCEFFRKAIVFTRRFPVLQRRKFFLGKDLDDDQVPDLTWFAPDLSRPQWDDTNVRTLCFQLDASEDGSDIGVKRLFFILHGHFESQGVKLPPLEPGCGWYRAIDTSLPSGEDFAEPGQEIPLDPSDHYITSPRSTVVLLAQPPESARSARRMPTKAAHVTPS